MRIAVAAALLTLVASTAHASARRGGYSLELLDEQGHRLPTFQQGDRTFVLGSQGTRYTLHIRNRTGQRVEFVASVDGRDVLDGQPSALAKRGYIVNPYDDVRIDGFRLNTDSVAAFRFSSVSQSYASKMGDARDVGVIGVAVFQEKPHYVPPPPPAFERGCDDAEGLKEVPEPAPAPMDMAAGASIPAPSMKSGLAGMGSGDGHVARAKKDRAGLGTEFGEARESHSYGVEFDRASEEPVALLSVRYNDRAGLVAMGVDLQGYTSREQEAYLRETASPFRRDPGFASPPPGWNGY